MSMLVSRSCSVSFWDDVPELSTFIWWMVVEHGLNHNLHEQGWKDDMNRCRCLRPSLKRVYFMNRAWREISTIINPVPVQEKKQQLWRDGDLEEQYLGELMTIASLDVWTMAWKTLWLGQSVELTAKSTAERRVSLTIVWAGYRLPSK